MGKKETLHLHSISVLPYFVSLNFCDDFIFGDQDVSAKLKRSQENVNFKHFCMLFYGADTEELKFNNLCNCHWWMKISVRENIGL